MKIVNLPSLKVIRLKRVKIYLECKNSQPFMVEGKEGGGGGGEAPHHHVYINVGKFSRLFFFVIIKQITFKLDDSTTSKALYPNLVPRALFPGFGPGKSALGTRLALSNWSTLQVEKNSWKGLPTIQAPAAPKVVR